MSEKQNTSVIQYLNQLSPIAIADDENVRNKFIALVDTNLGTGEGARVYQSERHYFQKMVHESQALRTCTNYSLYAAFMDCAIQGLSFDPSRKLAYVIPENFNVGTKDKPSFEKRALMKVTAYGELYLRMKYGQIMTADNPEVVYEGEEFTKFSGREGTVIEHRITMPRPNKPMVAAYVRLVKTNGMVDYYVLDLKGMRRLEEFSKKKNRGSANDLYRSGPNGTPDEGFWITKCVKHAFKAYPPVKIRGEYTVLETQMDDDEPESQYEFTEVKTTEPSHKQETETVKQEPVTQEAPKQEKKDRSIDF